MSCPFTNTTRPRIAQRQKRTATKRCKWHDCFGPNLHSADAGAPPAPWVAGNSGLSLRVAGDAPGAERPDTCGEASLNTADVRRPIDQRDARTVRTEADRASIPVSVENRMRLR